MHKFRVACFVFLLALGSSNAQSGQCALKDAKKILSATQCYLSTKTEIKPQSTVISNGLCAGNYARVTVHPKKPVTDDARVYLEKRHDSWQILKFGTHFDPEFLNTLPKELR